jgi:hypothetical protein
MPQVRKVAKEIEMSEIGALTGKSLLELQQMNLIQIRSAQNIILDVKSKKELIELEMTSTVFYDASIITYRPDGEKTLELRVKRDAEGVKTGTNKFEWSYYPPQADRTTPVDVITISELDANDKIIGTPKKLKHYTGGRQPEWI